MLKEADFFARYYGFGSETKADTLTTREPAKPDKPVKINLLSNHKDEDLIRLSKELARAKASGQKVEIYFTNIHPWVALEVVGRIQYIFADDRSKITIISQASILRPADIYLLKQAGIHNTIGCKSVAMLGPIFEESKIVGFTDLNDHKISEPEQEYLTGRIIDGICEKCPKMSREELAEIIKVPRGKTKVYTATELKELGLVDATF